MVAIFVRRSCLRAVLLVSLVVPAIAAAVDAPAPEKPMPAKTATAPFAMPAARPFGMLADGREAMLRWLEGDDH